MGPGAKPPDPIRGLSFLKQFCDFHEILYYFFEKLVNFSKFFCPRRGCRPPDTPQKRLSTGNHGNERNKVFVYHPIFRVNPPPKKKTKILHNALLSCSFVQNTCPFWRKRCELPHGNKLFYFYSRKAEIIRCYHFIQRSN